MAIDKINIKSLEDTLNLSSKTVTLPAVSVTAHSAIGWK